MDFDKINVEIPKLNNELATLLSYHDNMEEIVLSMDTIDLILGNLIRFLPAICKPFKNDDLLMYQRQHMSDLFEKYRKQLEDAIKPYEELKELSNDEVYNNFAPYYFPYLFKEIRKRYDNMYQLRKKFVFFRSEVVNEYNRRSVTFTILKKEIEVYIEYFDIMTRFKTDADKVFNCMNSPESTKSNYSVLEESLMIYMSSIRFWYDKYAFYLRLLFPNSDECADTMKDEVNDDFLYALSCVPIETKYEYYIAMDDYQKCFLADETLLKRNVLFQELSSSLAV